MNNSKWQMIVSDDELRWRISKVCEVHVTDSMDHLIYITRLSSGRGEGFGLRSANISYGRREK